MESDVIRLVTLTLAFVACSRPHDRIEERRSATAPAPAASSAAPAVLGGVPWQIDIHDPVLDPFDAGAPDASAAGSMIGVVSVPLGTREPRPIMIVLHGAADRPGWECGSWRAVTNAYPFLVCPRGVGPESALGWSSVTDTRARIARAIAATKTMFGSWVRDTPSVVLVGFSMGAVQAALVAQAEPTRYRRVVLGESAYAPESSLAFARPWARGGGERVALLCTTAGCPGPYRAAARSVAAEHARARVNIAAAGSHGMWDVVVRSMRRDWPWLVEKAEGWEAYAPPLEETALPGATEHFGDE